ncbi:MAG: hypothetical protein PHG24_00230 [Candidatus Pacebacteria bacterium]|nr:hypothetical protein [Candidatus Paceibacterota bacterium]
MIKKILLSIIISSTILATNVYATELPETEEDVKNVGIEIMNQVFSETFVQTFKENYNQYVAVYYTNLYNCFKETIGPKIETYLNKILSSEEYQEETLEIKEDLPNFWDRAVNFFENIKK